MKRGCQSCDGDLSEVLSLGYMPPCNLMRRIGEPLKAEEWLPTNLMRCGRCDLVQLEYEPDPAVVFPPSYSYTSGSTRLLRDNFANLAAEASKIAALDANDLVIDIGSNDGTLLSNFSTRVLGIEPTDIADVAIGRGIPTLKEFFGPGIASRSGNAKLVTCTNCFAHMPAIHGVIEEIREMLAPGGVFVTESHYLPTLLERNQYDTIYHEHLRYYSLTSLEYLLAEHGLEVFDAYLIPTHGGSVRAYAGIGGERPVMPSVGSIAEQEPSGDRLTKALHEFCSGVLESRLRLMDRLLKAKRLGASVVGIGAPSRASTVINYCRLDIDCVYETAGSRKIGHYMPGTKIPVVEEPDRLNGLDAAVLFSWHLADELMPKLRAKGFGGKFIFPCEP